MRLVLNATIALMLCSLVALAGCNGKTTTAPPEPKSGTIDVEMVNFAFSPKEETIKVGSTVRWTNKDAAPHDVSSKDGSWNSTGGMAGMNKGDVYSRTFSTAGTFDYYCKAHGEAAMSGRIIVK